MILDFGFWILFYSRTILLQSLAFFFFLCRFVSFLSSCSPHPFFFPLPCQAGAWMFLDWLEVNGFVPFSTG